jgi:hypothetical protein
MWITNGLRLTSSIFHPKSEWLRIDIDVMIITEWGNEASAGSTHPLTKSGKKLFPNLQRFGK